MVLPKTMQGVVLTGHGGFEKLEYRDDLPLPIYGVDDVLIRVGAASINNTDINTRTAWYAKTMADDVLPDDATWASAPMAFPRIQGADACGAIVAVGRDIDPSRLGERVLIEPCMFRSADRNPDEALYLGSEIDGGFAQFIKIPASYAYAVNSPMTDAELASFPCSYSTAENMLTRASVKAGETVLVTGASGGVGSAAVQLANRRQGRVIAVASTNKHQAVLDLGADQVISRGEPLANVLGHESVDVVIDLVAGDDWPDLIKILKRGGRYATAGAIAGPLVQLDVRDLYLKDLSLFGCTVLGRGVFANLVRYIELGEIKPVVAQTFPLRDIVAAQEAFLAKQHTGKLVLIPPRSNMDC